MSAGTAVNCGFSPAHVIPRCVEFDEPLTEKSYEMETDHFGARSRYPDHTKRSSQTVTSHTSQSPRHSSHAHRSHTHHGQYHTSSYGPYSLPSTAPSQHQSVPHCGTRQALLTSSFSYSTSQPPVPKSTLSNSGQFSASSAWSSTPSYQSGSGASRRVGEEDWRSESWSQPYDVHAQSSLFRQRPRHVPHQPYSLPSFVEDFKTPQNEHPTSLRLSSPRRAAPRPTPLKSLSSNTLEPPYSVRSSPHHPSSYIDILSQPEDQCVEQGTTVELLCEARVLNTSDVPLYQWYKDEEPLVGELDSKFSITNMTASDVGYYFCVVANISGSIQRKSHSAHVCLKEEDISKPCRPIILHQPDARIQAHIGQRLVLKLTVQANPEPLYLWYREGEEMGSVSGPELVFPCVTARDEASYMCCVKNSLGSQLSSSFTLQLLKSPPSSVHSDSDDDTALHHKEIESSTEVPTPSYRTPTSPVKLVRGQNSQVNRYGFMGGANKVSDGLLNIVAGQLSHHISIQHINALSHNLEIDMVNLARIRARYSNLHEIIMQLLLLWRSQTPYPDPQSLETLLQEKGYRVSVPQASSPHPLPVPRGGSGPVIVSHPSHVRALYGEKVTLTMEAKGSNIYYQWYQNGSILPNCTGPVLVIPRLQESSKGSYYCEVRNLHNTVSTHLAEVDIMYGKPKLPPSLRGNYQSPCYGPSPLSSVAYSPTVERGCGLYEHRNGDSPYSSMESLTSSLTSSVSRISENGSHAGMMSERLAGIRLDDRMEYSVPVIKVHPQTQDVGQGERLLLNVVAVGGDHLQYMWYFNGLELSSHTHPNFLLYHFTDEDMGDYFCKVSNEIGSVKSNVAKVTLRRRDNEMGPEENRPEEEEVRREENRDDSL